MDATRTCLRLGAEEVILLYRRSRKEMPAHPLEIAAAEEEGLKVQFLASPANVFFEEERLVGLEYIRNELKGIDASGRPRPVPIPGSETRIAVDQIMVATGQQADYSFLKWEKELTGLALTDRGALRADPSTLQCSIPYLFTGGDFYRGPSTVIQAIADGRQAAQSIHQYLNRQPAILKAKPFNISKGKLDEVDLWNFAAVSTQPRVHPPVLPIEERQKNFREVELGLNENHAKEDANLCLSCGCLDGFECGLREWATEYQIDPQKLTVWKSPRYLLAEAHPFINVDPNKCISCKSCEEACSNYQVQKAFEFREEKREGKESNGLIPFINERCVSCGFCVANCPTGALQEKLEGKPGPFALKKVKTTCPYCGVGCQITLGVVGEEVVRVEGVPGVRPNYGHLCVKGRFGYHFINHPERLRSPLIRENGQFREATWDEALDHVAGRFCSLRDQYGPNSLAALASARITNEENFLLQKFVRAVLKTNNIDHCARL